MYIKKKKIPKTIPKPCTAQDALFNELYGLEVENPVTPATYRARLACELSYPDRPIPGLLIIDQYCFDAAHDMPESGERLKKRIDMWTAQHHNSVSVRIHHAKCVKWKELVHYVHLLPSKWFSGIDCPDREYDDLRAFIRSLPEYQRSP